MIQKSGLRLGKLVLTAVFGASMCGSAIAHGDGRGGDSSMNPFTGDSYAYFHGGHNLGEQGMNIPWRTPVPKSADSSDRNLPNATAKSPAPTTNGATGAFRSIDASHEDQRTDSQQAGKR